MPNLGNVSAFNINGNELTIKDPILTDIVGQIIEAIGANNNNIAERINDLHSRSFDYTLDIISNNNSEIASIQDGIYKLHYVTVTGSGENEVRTINNSAIMIQDGDNQYLYKDGQLHSRSKTNNTWSNWTTFEGGVTSVNGQTGAVTVDVGVTSFNGSTGAITYTAPVTSVNGLTGTITGLATESYVGTAIANLVDSAPGTLDTLNELAAALGDDPNFATTVAGQIGAKYTKSITGIPESDLEQSVQDKINNPGVTSFNGATGAINYTAPVTSVNGQTGTVTLALGDTNVIETVKVNNTSLTPVSKAVNITVPTKVSDLTNDSGFTSNIGTITSITMNGVSKGTSGAVDLGTVLTEHQDISGKVDKVTGMGLSTNDYTTTEKNKLAGINIGSLDSLTTAELNSIFATS